MYEAVQMTTPFTEEYISMMERVSLDSNEIDINELNDKYFSEAVFSRGKETLKPILDALIDIRKEFDDAIEKHKETSKEHRKDENVKVQTFDPTKFYSSLNFKKLEDEIQKAFGFRSVMIEPFRERYNPRGDVFESGKLTAYTYASNRYPIEGLVSDKGFYDKTHTITLMMQFSLKLFQMLTPEEFLGVSLHEIGHNVDPALVNIKYTQTNVLAKYLSDRKVSDKEKSVLGKIHSITDEGLAMIMLIVTLLGAGILSFIGKLIDKLSINKENEKRTERIKNMIRRDTKFTRQEYSEAFADNFARMYGYGAQCMSGLHKIEKFYNEKVKSRFEKEKERERFILMITEDAIKDCHKTDIHRIRNLMQEYKNDINDKTIPEKVRKDLQEDLENLEKLLDAYLNDFDEVQNRINQMVNSELEKVEKRDAKKKTEPDKKESNDKK